MIVADFDISCSDIELATMDFTPLISYREEFDEEKEPDGMVLSGWTQAPAVEKKDENHVGNGVGTSKNMPTSAEQAETNEDVEIVPADIEIPVDKKRKLAEIANSDGMGTSRVAAETNNHSKVEELDDDDKSGSARLPNGLHLGRHRLSHDNLIPFVMNLWEHMWMLH